MIGATRSRVTFFMIKLRRLWFIEYKDGLKVNASVGFTRSDIAGSVAAHTSFTGRRRFRRRKRLHRDRRISSRCGWAREYI